jgi:hypothetical protein
MSAKSGLETDGSIRGAFSMSFGKFMAEWGVLSECHHIRFGKIYDKIRRAF